MQTVAKPPYLASLLFVLVALCAAPGATAQDGAPLHPAWQRIETVRAELAGLPAVDADATDEDAIAALERRLQLERELRDALGTLVDAAGTADVDQPAIIAELERQTGLLKKEIAALGARIDRVRGERDDAAPEMLLDYEYRLRELHQTLGGLLQALLENTTRMARLDVDTSRHAAALDELLKARAARLSGRLGLTVDRIASTRARRWRPRRWHQR
ncbi:MAG: hypothetical protein RLW42_16330, partial [Gammaproteobacteria bacterium]